MMMSKQLNLSEIEVQTCALRGYYLMHGSLSDENQFPIVVSIGEQSLSVYTGAQDIRKAALAACEEAITEKEALLRQLVNGEVVT